MHADSTSSRRLWLGLACLIAAMVLVTGACLLFIKQIRIAAQWSQATRPIEELGGGVAWFSDYADRDVYRAEEIVASISLRGPDITDDDLAVLARYPNLINVSLESTSVTDQGLEHLKSLKSLVYVNLSGTRVTDEGEAALRKALPSCGVAR